jgi:hypothetical protein
MVSVLGVPLMLAYDPSVVSTVNKGHALYPDAIKELPTNGGDMAVRVIAILVTLVIIGWAVWQSKRSVLESPASTEAGKEALRAPLP